MVSKNRIRSFLNRPFTTQSEEETLRLAERLGKTLRSGTVVALTGEIGSGKTTFIKGLCRGLGVKARDEVKSPTFVLLHIYAGRFPVRHFDLYRLEKEAELDAIGFDEFISDPKTVALVEWADRAPARIPKDSLWIELRITGQHSRRISVGKPK